jgi:hypothetical protein
MGARWVSWAIPIAPRFAAIGSRSTLRRPQLLVPSAVRNDFPGVWTRRAKRSSGFLRDPRRQWKCPALCGVVPSVHWSVFVWEGPAAGGGLLEVGSDASLL